jgi:hypothetical protein
VGRGPYRGSGLYSACVGRVVLLTFCSTYLLLLGNAAFALPSCALRGVISGATMSIPGGTGTTPRTVSCNIFYVLGAPASLIGSELSVYLAPALRLCPTPIP